MGRDTNTTGAGSYLKETGLLLWDAGKAWYKDNAMRLSAAVAMYAVLSLAPVLVITIKIVGLVLSEATARGQIERQVEEFLGPQGKAAVDAMIAGAGQMGAGIWATTISLLFLLYTASGVFVEFRDALNAVWRIPDRPGGGIWERVRERLLSAGMVLAVGFLLLVTQFLTTVLTALSVYMAGGPGWLAVVIDFATSFLLLTAVFAMLFRFLPDARVGWRYVVAGAAATAVLFKIGQFLQALYFTYGSTASLYGAAGSFVVVLLWVYYSCWIVLYGAELIQVYAHRHGEQLIPSREGSVLRSKSEAHPAGKDQQADRLTPATAEAH